MEDGTRGFTVKKGENVCHHTHTQVCFYTHSDEDEVCKESEEESEC